MRYANSYRGGIPLQLYLSLQTFLPQLAGETDQAWVARAKSRRDLRDVILQMIGMLMLATPEFKQQLQEAAYRRLMAQAGARKIGRPLGGPVLSPALGAARTGLSVEESLRQPPPSKRFAPQFQDEFIDPNDWQYRYADEAWNMLLEQFDAAMPANGSIFWNGINELALAKLVDQWNTTLAGEIFGQLEATTAARYVNKKFEWEGVFQNYFTEVSSRIAMAASGHVTSVVRCGLRHDSIFTMTELPRLLGEMENDIKARRRPRITDITIVVLEPKGSESPARAFTNHAITTIPIVAPVGRLINGRDSCTVVGGKIHLNARIGEYWNSRKGVLPSAAALRIMSDFSTLVRWP